MKFRDQMHREIEIAKPPQRIVSLVPSQTELLADLGLADRIVGITKFCVHPKGWKSEKQIVGGTKHLRFEVIEALKPDLIIANKEENRQADVQILSKKYPVWVSDVKTLANAYEMIQSIGAITDSGKKAEAIVSEIERCFKNIVPSPLKRKALYIIWKNPWMAAGNDTFIHDMLCHSGFENALESVSRYPELTEEEIRALQPEVVLLSSEPFPFNEQHISEVKTMLPDAQVCCVDGELFSWYGSRLRLAPAYFQRLASEL